MFDEWKHALTTLFTMQASTSLAFSTPRKSCRSTLKCHPGKLGTTVASVPPLPFEFPADHPPAPRASARHAVVISVLPQSTVIYTCCPRDPSKQRCFRFNSDRTLHNTADSGPSKRFCPLSSKNIASHTQQNGAGTNELDKCRHLSFFFSTSCRLPPKYAGHMLYSSRFRVKQTSPTSTQLSFFSRSVCVVLRPFFFLVTASRTRI